MDAIKAIRLVDSLFLASSVRIGTENMEQLNPGIKLNSGSDFVRVNVSNSRCNTVALELKFQKSLSVGELKKKLEVITGGNADTMRLELYNGEHLEASLNDNGALVGSLPINEGSRIHVIDNFALFAEETVEKYELSADQYEQKEDTVRSFLKKNRLGKYNEDEMQQKEELRRQQEQMESEKAALCVVGARCQVQVAGNPTRYGTVMYNGPLDGKKGVFIGVEYDEPLGKNNGSVNGKAYFECKPNYGGFVSPMAVEVGDFPQESHELDEI